MEGGVRPIHCPKHMAVLHRIEVDVINVAAQIGLVPNQALPIATLPTPAFPFIDSARTPALPMRNVTRKPRLQQSPTQWIVAVAGRQRPDRMQMIG